MSLLRKVSVIAAMSTLTACAAGPQIYHSAQQTKATIHSDFVTPRNQIAFAGYSFDAGASRIGFAMESGAATTIYSLPQDAATLTF